MKLGLIAMSGIRVCDDELLRLGLTLPGFVERSRTIASLPSLGLLTLAGATPLHHRICYREIEDVHRLGPELERFDLVAISTYTAQIGEAYELADRYRALGIPVVLGGLHVTVEPDEALAHADAVVLGDGECAWRRVLRDAESGRLHPIYRATPGGADLAQVPVPVFELLEPERYNRLTVQASRGCPMRCEFCASSTLLSQRYRQKPIARVLHEIDRIREIWPRPFLEFADDNALVNKAWWRQFLPRLALRELRWFAETDLSIARDPDLLDLMRESGCAEVLIGLESPVEAGLDGLELNANWKRQQLPRYREAIETIQSHGVRVNGCFVIGLDGQGPEIFDQVFRFAEECCLYDVQITIATPFPGTPLLARLRREGRMLEDRPWARCTLFDLTFRPSPMSADELVAGFHDLAVRLYDEPFTRWRRENVRKRFLRRARSLARA
ncbi:MAG: B12-binding domain-containing radical SAM protein [Acidobacteria bacterium]|jgi:radical SAM superfamily enzyme YgiQ (UPF0313 family)|nr:B12-binding domain-containing radical SAM protein [Acidobacteriota bacterium]